MVYLFGVFFVFRLFCVFFFNCFFFGLWVWSDYLFICLFFNKIHVAELTSMAFLTVSLNPFQHSQ